MTTGTIIAVAVVAAGIGYYAHTKMQSPPPQPPADPILGGVDDPKLDRGTIHQNGPDDPKLNHAAVVNDYPEQNFSDPADLDR